MKLKTSLLILTLACGTLWAQNQADKNPKPAAKTPAPATKNVPAPASNHAAPKTSAAAPAKAMPQSTAQQKPAPKPLAVPPPKPVVVPAPKPAVKTPPTQQAKSPMKPKIIAPMTAKKTPKAAGEVKEASAKETTRVSSGSSGKQRDPFVSPVMRSNGVISSGCDTGKRCLVVDQIVLKGIVKSPSGFIAVVENPAKRAYFMRENDPVFNGKVVKITGDTIVFQEQVLDKVGKQSMREVVKKVNAPVV